MTLTKGAFLCGCFPDEKRGYSGDIISLGPNQQTYTDKRYDNEGYEVCPEHGQRMYGWRSPLISTPLGSKLDYATIYGKRATLKLQSAEEIEDKRFNDDPEIFYSNSGRRFRDPVMESRISDIAPESNGYDDSIIDRLTNGNQRGNI